MVQHLTQSALSYMFKEMSKEYALIISKQVYGGYMVQRAVTRICFCLAFCTNWLTPILSWILSVEASPGMQLIFNSEHRRLLLWDPPWFHDQALTFHQTVARFPQHVAQPGELLYRPATSEERALKQWGWELAAI